MQTTVEITIDKDTGNADLRITSIMGFPTTRRVIIKGPNGFFLVNPFDGANPNGVPVASINDGVRLALATLE